MWICRNCGANNNGNSRFCAGCGKPQSEVALPAGDEEGSAWTQPAPETWSPPAPGAYPGGYAAPPAGAWAAPAPVKKKSLWWVWLLVVLAVLAAAAVVCYSTVHIWSPATCTEASVCKICGEHQGIPLGHAFTEATCTEPKTCTRCGVKEGAALGHAYQAATCTEPKTCTRCGATDGEPLGHSANEATCTDASVCSRCGEIISAALGHDWEPATYDAPETCSRCGETRGNVKGYFGNLHGSLNNEALYLYSDTESHAYVLDEPVHRCRYMCLNLELTYVDGDPYGTWGIYCRDLNGSWQLLTTIQVTSSVYYSKTAFDLYLDGSLSFDALSIVPFSDADYSVSYSYSYTNVQEYVD